MNIIDSVDTLSAVEFDKIYYKTSKPVIHRRALGSTNFFKDWSFEYLKSKCGSRLVEISYSKKGYYDYTNGEIYERRKVLFAKAIEYFTSKEKSKNYYLQQTSIHEYFPELIEEIKRPPLIMETDIVVSQNIWIGGSGCITPLHYDFAPNILVQVRGRKKLILFSPEDYNYLYPRQQETARHLSEINLRDVDSNLFPLFKKAKPFECIIEPGDVLFIPPYWWHEVHSLEACISLNFWFNR